MDHQKVLAFTETGRHVLGIGGASLVVGAVLLVGIGAFIIKRRFRVGVNATDAQLPK